MKVVTSAPVSGFQGTTKNSAYVFFMRNGLCFAREAVTPANPSTDDQELIRAYIRAATRNWSLLTQVQRDGWATFTTAHQSPTGLLQAIDLYVQCNMYRQILGQALTTTAPTSTYPVSPTGITQTQPGDDTDIDFTITHTIATGSVGNYKLLVKNTGEMPTLARTPTQRLASLIKGVATTSALTLLATGNNVYDFTSVKHTVAPAKRFGLSAQIIETATGLTSAPLFADLIKTAAP